MTKNPKMRLGSSALGGERIILLHPYFKELDWDLLNQRQIEPPFRPRIVSVEICYWIIRQTGLILNFILAISDFWLTRVELEDSAGWSQGVGLIGMMWNLSPQENRVNTMFYICVWQKSKEDVSNFDPEFLKEEPLLTPIEDRILSMINQEEFRNFSYTDPELES